MRSLLKLRFAGCGTHKFDYITHVEEPSVLVNSLRPNKVNTRMPVSCNSTFPFAVYLVVGTIEERLPESSSVQKLPLLPGLRLLVACWAEGLAPQQLDARGR